MTRIAIFADLHLPDRADTVKDTVYDWALATAASERVDLIVGAGDMTSIGTAAAARRLRQKAGAMPLLVTPGNAELRTEDETAACLEFLAGDDLREGVILLDTSAIRLSPSSRARLSSLPPRLNLLAVTHCPHHYLPAEDQQLLTERLVDQAIGTLVSGHIHRDENHGPYQVVRGLDPDKALGGPPAFVILDNCDGAWRRQDIACDFADPRTWPAEERAEWLGWLGISGMKDTLAALAAAAENGVPGFEIRASESLSLPAPTLNAAVDSWRQRGGRHLSIHLPAIGLDAADAVSVPADMSAAIALAGRLRAGAVTLHPPAAPLGRLRAEPRLYTAMLEAYEQTLRPLAEAGVVIGIENMHLRRGEPADDQRFFGYTPLECREWIAALRERLGKNAVGFHLDIGHARNNRGLASRYNLSEWYAELGAWMTGCHLHQFAQVDGKAQNHCPIKELFGRTISLSSFFLAWRQGQLAHAPMFLEIRTEPAIDSFFALRGMLS
ncbi:MAG: TIM barrel protein [Lentisphaeria bacterium]|nr:TIM barrel protein [Lentisphaeria bacterium]